MDSGVDLDDRMDFLCTRDLRYDSPDRTDIGLIQDYFGKTIGHVKKVYLTYGPEGRSRGIAQIVFGGPQSAAEAAKKLDGVKVDNRPMRVSANLVFV